MEIILEKSLTCQTTYASKLLIFILVFDSTLLTSKISERVVTSVLSESVKLGIIEKITNIAEIVIPPAIATLRPKFHLAPFYNYLNCAKTITSRLCELDKLYVVVDKVVGTPLSDTTRTITIPLDKSSLI